MTRHASPEDRRSQILTAAMPCFASKGYHQATMDDLARAAGLSKGSLYWHFRSKDDVFLALFDELAGAVLAGWDGLESRGLPAPELLRAQGALVIDLLGQHLDAAGAWLGFLAHPAARERLGETYAVVRTRIAGVIRGGTERGELRAVDADAVAGLLTAAVEGLVLLAMVDSEFDARAAWRGAWEAMWKGLEPG